VPTGKRRPRLRPMDGNGSHLLDIVGITGVPQTTGSGRGGGASRTDVEQVDTSRFMMVLVDGRDAGVGHLHTSDLRRLTLGGKHGHGWSSPRPVGQLRRDPVGYLLPQAEPRIVALSPLIECTDIAERHDSSRSATVSLLGDRSAAILDYLEKRGIPPDLLDPLLGLLVPTGNDTHHPVVICGQPSLRERATSKLFVGPGVPPLVRIARRGRNPVHEIVDRPSAAGLLDLIQRRRAHECRLLRRCSGPAETRGMQTRPSASRAPSPRNPRAATRNRGCQRVPAGTQN